MLTINHIACAIKMWQFLVIFTDINTYLLESVEKIKSYYSSVQRDCYMVSDAG